jgi:tRNA (mo5U34)-methyltransferase
MLEVAKARFDSILNGKTLKPLNDAVCNMKAPKGTLVVENDTVYIKTELKYDENSAVYELAKSLMPWRKGPFKIDDIFIDSEWNSGIKYSILEPYIDAKDKIIGDIGCNNGYYLFRLLEKNPKELIGFDPGANFYLQFKFIDAFLNSGIKFLPYGVEHLEAFKEQFDILLCLGVIYHRTDPIAMLKSLKSALKKDGELILDSMILDSSEDIALCPKASYAKMSNVFFVPTKTTLQNWLEKAGFEWEFLGELKTTTKEQRKTEWIYGQSLDDFLDQNNKDLTIEGYPAPIRAYYKCRRK